MRRSKDFRAGLSNTFALHTMILLLGKIDQNQYSFFLNFSAVNACLRVHCSCYIRARLFLATFSHFLQKQFDFATIFWRLQKQAEQRMIFIQSSLRPGRNRVSYRPDSIYDFIVRGPFAHQIQKTRFVTPQTLYFACRTVPDKRLSHSYPSSAKTPSAESCRNLSRFHFHIRLSSASCNHHAALRKKKKVQLHSDLANIGGCQIFLETPKGLSRSDCF